MKKLNTKAFTVIELIITFSVVMTISLGLFKVVDTYREKQQQESYKKQINGYINEVVKIVKEDMLKTKVKKIEGFSCDGYNQGIKITFDDVPSTSKELCVGTNSGDNGIKYNNIFYKVPSKFITFKDDFILETLTDTVEKPIYNKIKKDAVDENKITVPVITKEIHYTIDIKLKHSELDKLFNITISSSTRKIENKEERLSDDINSPSHYIKKVQYPRDNGSNLDNKYIDEYEIIFNDSKSDLKLVTDNITIENSVINTINLSLRANGVLQTYLENNKVNEVDIPSGNMRCSDVTEGKENPSCSITLQTGYVKDSGGKALYNFNNMNKFIVNDFEDDNEVGGVKKPYNFYNIKFFANGYIKSLDLRNLKQNEENVYNIFIPYNGIQIGNIYVSNLVYDSIDNTEDFNSVSKDKTIHALLAGYLFYGIAKKYPGIDRGTLNFNEIIDVQAYCESTNSCLYQDVPATNSRQELKGITNLVIDPKHEGELVNLPTAIKNKVTNLVLGNKVTSVSDSLKSSGLKDFGIKTIKYENDVLDGVVITGFSCNDELNKCTYTG